MIIEMKVEKRKASLLKSAKIVLRNGGYKMRFEFDDEWAELPEKTARFVYNGIGVEAPIVNNECTVPVIEDAKKVAVGVYASEDVVTNAVAIPCEKSIFCLGGKEIVPEKGDITFTVKNTDGTTVGTYTVPGGTTFREFVDGGFDKAGIFSVANNGPLPENDSISCMGQYIKVSSTNVGDYVVADNALIDGYTYYREG